MKPQLALGITEDFPGNSFTPDADAVHLEWTVAPFNAGLAAIRNVTLQGMIVNADAPMEISFNVFEKCGTTNLAFSGLCVSPTGHLRDINATVVVKENVFTDSRGAAIVFASDSVSLAADDGDIATDIFLRDRQTDTTIAVTDPTDHPKLTSRLQGGSDCSISADGSVVAFGTTEHRFTNTGFPRLAARACAGAGHWAIRGSQRA